MIEWYRVTWYSRIGALFLFLVVVPALCLYLGEQYGALEMERAPIVAGMIEKNIGAKLSPGFVELHFGTLDSMSTQNKTSVVATVTGPSTKEITIYTSDDPGDARIRIHDVVTGKQCDTAYYLVTRVLLFEPTETIAIVYHYNGSNNYVTTVDTATCKPIGSIGPSVDPSIER